MRLLKHFMITILIVVGVLFLMVLRDIINPPREGESTFEASFVIHPQEPEGYVHGDYVLETAYNLGIDSSEVTQEQFDERYSNPQN